MPSHRDFEIVINHEHGLYYATIPALAIVEHDADVAVAHDKAAQRAQTVIDSLAAAGLYRPELTKHSIANAARQQGAGSSPMGAPVAYATADLPRLIFATTISMTIALGIIATIFVAVIRPLLRASLTDAITVSISSAMSPFLGTAAGPVSAVDIVNGLAEHAKNWPDIRREQARESVHEILQRMQPIITEIVKSIDASRSDVTHKTTPSPASTR